MDEQYIEDKMVAESQLSRMAIENNPNDERKMPQWFYWVVWGTFFLVVASIAVGIWQGNRLKNTVADLEEKTKAFNEDALRDSTAFMQPIDVRYLVAESTRESFNTYVSTQNNMLSLLGIIISALVAIVGIAVPVVVNNSLRNNNEIWFKKRTNEGISQMKTETADTLEKSKKDLEAASSRNSIEVRNQMEARLKEIQEKIDKLERGAVDKIMSVKHEESLEQVAEKKDNAAKIEYLESEIKKNKENYPASGFYELGKLYFEERKNNEAINRFEMAIERNPDYVEAYQALAEVYMKDGDFKEAWKKIETALSIKENSSLHETRCKTFKGMGMYEAALKDVEEGIRLAKRESETMCLDRLRSLGKEISQKQKEDQLTKKVVEELNVKGITFKMKKVSGGSFTMGASDDDKDAQIWELPAHRVLLDDYYIGETVVTQKLWKAVMGNNPSKFKGDDCPVEKISWDDCQVFIQKLNALTKCTFRLPTEAEWEFAARGGNKNENKGYKYSGSNDVNEVAWYWQNSGDNILEGTEKDWDLDKIVKNNSRTHPVMGKAPNELGIYDMSGNVWEWCSDWFGDYCTDPQPNPKGPEVGQDRVARGGSWPSYARHCRVSSRSHRGFSRRGRHLGFRLVLVPESIPETDRLS